MKPKKEPIVCNDCGGKLLKCHCEEFGYKDLLCENCWGHQKGIKISVYKKKRLKELRAEIKRITKL